MPAPAPPPRPPAPVLAPAPAGLPVPTGPPRVSVIVPVHDVAPYVAGAIASLKAQTLRDFEALVIDDGSTDGSGAVAAQAIGGDPRFRLIRQDNRGLSAARNAGLSMARGAWLAFLDGDDAFEPGFLSRLIAGAEGAGLPWAACALWLVGADGQAVAHSAIHGQPDPAGMAARTLALDDARQVARLFPSAWNKVYSRALFDGVRFTEGTWFEDHEVWWTLARRAGAIRHLPEPLYRHRRGRPGQITAADDDRALQILPVLDRLRPLVAPFDAGGEGMARLSSRLIHERAQVVRTPARRALFLARAGDWLARNGLAYDPSGDDDLSAGLSLALSGEAPLRLLAADPPPAGAIRDAQCLPLAPASWPGLTGPDDGADWRYLLLAPPDVVLLPPAVEALVDAAVRADADLALGGLLMPDGGHHDGWTDNRLAPPAGSGPGPLSARAVLRLHPGPARMLVRRDLLARLGGLSVPPNHPRAGAELVLRAGLAARRVLLSPAPVARLRPPVAPVPDPPPGPDPLAWALALPGDAALPAGWRTVLALRVLRPGMPPARSPAGIAARLALGVRLARAGLRARGPGPRALADPGTDRLLSVLAGLPLSPP